MFRDTSNGVGPTPQSEPKELHMLYTHVIITIAVVVHEVQSDLVDISDPFDRVGLILAATLCHEGVQYFERGNLAHLHCPRATATVTTAYSHLSDSMPLPIERVVDPLVARLTLCGIPVIAILLQSVLRLITTTIM